ncbi:hypothetical protein Mgra_00007181 [Meloidogyne graminicola]|uniref:Uncharacterized protein n=1 Tax=Meloidogyne graminicola TaxID=189291 RepID=A0A8S9ZJA4_9BILA|nr:hypothetical protein Mgra_00007181 [Meloidogyne graminicola]
MGLFRVLIYGIMLGVYTGALFYDIRFVPIGGSRLWISKLVMLSMLNLLLQSIYSVICFFCALFDWNAELEHNKQHKKQIHVPSYWRRTKLHNICDFMYATSATCLMSLYAVNPGFVMPAWIAQMIPNWLNHVTHTAPIAFILIDTLLTCHHAPDRKVGSLVVLLLFLFYLSIILSTRLLFGYWLYPIFEHLDVYQINFLLVVTGLLFWFLYLVGDGMNVMLWGKAPHSIDSMKQKVK